MKKKAGGGYKVVGEGERGLRYGRLKTVPCRQALSFPGKISKLGSLEVGYPAF